MTEEREEQKALALKSRTECERLLEIRERMELKHRAEIKKHEKKLEEEKAHHEKERTQLTEEVTRLTEAQTRLLNNSKLEEEKYEKKMKGLELKIEMQERRLKQETMKAYGSPRKNQKKVGDRKGSQRTSTHRGSQVKVDTVD